MPTNFSMQARGVYAAKVFSIVKFLPLILTSYRSSFISRWEGIDLAGDSMRARVSVPHEMCGDYKMRSPLRILYILYVD